MNKHLFAAIGLIGALSVTTRGDAGTIDRPQGVKIGQRLTLVPYVSLSATYDSNVGSRNNEKDNDIVWTVNPNLTFTYAGEEATAQLNTYYAYRGYTRQHDSIGEGNQHSYGESFYWTWSNEADNGKGWKLTLSEKFQQIRQADDISTAYNGYNSDRREAQVGGVVQRRFNELWHGDVNASYYWLDYENDGKNVSLYGWQRWTAGAEVGFAPSKWTDIILAGSYQGYHSDNSRDSMRQIYQDVSSESQGWTVQGGLGTFATERISYRVLAGWSMFEYGDDALTDNGFTYTVSGNWKIGDTWNMMLLGSSYYQPSEREYASASRVDSLSWGLAKSMIRGKLVGRLDLTYRHETHESTVNSGYDYALDVITGRIGLDYTLNRFFVVFANVEYINSFNDADDAYAQYDYDRWRASLGLRLTY